MPWSSVRTFHSKDKSAVAIILLVRNISSYHFSPTLYDDRYDHLCWVIESLFRPTPPFVSVDWPAQLIDFWQLKIISSADCSICVQKWLDKSELEKGGDQTNKIGDRYIPDIATQRVIILVIEYCDLLYGIWSGTCGIRAKWADVCVIKCWTVIGRDVLSIIRAKSDNWVISWWSVVEWSITWSISNLAKIASLQGRNSVIDSWGLKDEIPKFWRLYPMILSLPCHFT